MTTDDPAHLRDSDAPCESCGAYWDVDEDGAGVMQHNYYCIYISAQDDEAAEREVRENEEWSALQNKDYRDVSTD